METTLPLNRFIKVHEWDAEYFGKVFFVFIIGLSAYLLLSLPQINVAKFAYAISLGLAVTAFMASHRRIKNSLSTLSFLLLLFIGLYYPLDLEKIEELYILLPFIYLTIHPGSFYPIAVSILLTSAYFPTIDAHELSDVIEDIIELVVITSFATVMVYFQQKSLRQMHHFRFESYTDYLTRLPNRKKFMEHMSGLKTQATLGEIEHHFALLIVDLDGFKKINDQLGHIYGDQVLRMVADRLAKLVNRHCYAYRIGGDEFAFLLDDTPKLLQSKAEALAQKVLTLCQPPYTLLNKHYTVTASIGIASYPIDANEIEILCSNADMAMYRAKYAGKNSFSFYDNQLMEVLVKRHELENDLKQAIHKKELFLLYQPKVCLTTGQFDSAEALIRWRHPKYGLINPAEFIDIAEESNSIIEIGLWVMSTACHQLMLWREQYNFRCIAVNVSSVQLQQTSFSHDVLSILTEHQCPAECLEIEQTESWIMDNPALNIAVLTKLKKIGVRLSLDDFGTAYSSLSQIGRLPLDILKIDKSFIDHCVEKQNDHMIVRTIIQLGHNLGMKIVAEGVETEAQRQLLQQEGCDEYQGYLFAKPLSIEEFECKLIQQKTKA